MNAPYIDNYNSCGANDTFGTVAQPVWHSSHSLGEWRFAAPLGTTVVGWLYHRGAYLNGWASANIFKTPYTVFDSINLHELCQAAAGCREMPWLTVNSPIPATNGLKFMLEACGPAPGGSCDGSSNGALRIWQTAVTLEDGNAPWSTGLQGELVESAPVRGMAGASWIAQDVGTGVYRAITRLNGRVVEDRVVDSNGGRCASVLPPARDFHYTVPCRLSTRASISIDTTRLSEGSHSLGVELEDAAGNGSFAVSRRFTVDNHPLPAGDLPAIAGQTRVGRTLTARPGDWENAQGGFSYRWMRCDASGGGCTQIATGASLVLTLADVGSTIRLRMTVTNAGAESVTVTSAPSAVVQEAEPPAGGRGGDDGRLPTPDSPPPPDEPPGGNTNVPRADPPSPPPPGPGPIPNGSNASRHAVLHASFPAGRRELLLKRPAGVRVTGRLLNRQNGEPITGATIDRGSRLNVSNAPERPGNPVRTDHRGRFSFLLGRNMPGHVLRLRYREHHGGPTVASTTLRLRVRSGLRWSANSSRRVLHFRGRISGPAPRRAPHQYVEVQWRRGKTWATLAHPVVVRGDGRWRLRYAVGSNVRSGTRFRFRVSMRARSSAYAYEPISSRARWVTVR